MQWCYLDVFTSVLGKRYSLLGRESLGLPEYYECLEWSLRSCAGEMELPGRMVALELHSADQRRSCSSRKDYFSRGGSALLNSINHACRSLSTVGGTQWPINPPLLSSSHSPSFPPHSPRNGVRSHSRCGTEWTELELAFHLTVTFLIRLQGPNDSLH